MINFFLVVNLASTVKTVDKGYESLQSLTYVIQDQIKLESTSDLDRERWKCLDVELSRVPPLSANGYFFISKSSLVSMLSVRKIIISFIFKINHFLVLIALSVITIKISNTKITSLNF